MSYVRVWQDLDVEKIKKNLLIWGTLDGMCANCKKVGLKLEERFCPECKTEFKYLALREKNTPSNVFKIKKKRPDLTIIDYKDFSEQISLQKAKKIL